MGFFSKKQAAPEPANSPQNDSIGIEELAPDEVTFFETNRQNLAHIFNVIGQKPQVGQTYTPEQVSAAVKAWLKTPGLGEKVQLDQTVYRHALATAWGDYLNEQFDMEWKVIHDQYGAEIGVIKLANDARAFPFQILAKSFDQASPDTVVVMTPQVKAIVESSSKPVV